MADSKDLDAARRRRLPGAKSSARETPNEGHAIAKYNAALRKGSSREATKALKPIFKDLSVSLD